MKAFRLIGLIYFCFGFITLVIHKEYMISLLYLTGCFYCSRGIIKQFKRQES